MNKASVTRCPDVLTRAFGAADPNYKEIVLGGGPTRVRCLEGRLLATCGTAGYQIQMFTSRLLTHLLALQSPMTSRAFCVTYEVRSWSNRVRIQSRFH